MINCINSKESMEDLIGKRIQSIIGAIFLLPAVFTLIPFICEIPEILKYAKDSSTSIHDDLTVFMALEQMEPSIGVAIWVGLSGIIGAYLLKGSIGAWFVTLE